MMAVGRLVPPPSLPTEIARMTLAHLPASTSLESIYPFVCQLAAAALKVERVGIWCLEENDTILRCVNVYQMSKGVHSSGMMLEVARISCYVESLQRRRSLPAEIVEALPWTAELYAGYCEPLGITSILDAGIFHNGRLTGAVCNEHVGPVRDWSSEERHFAESLADFIASRLGSSEDLKSSDRQRSDSSAQDNERGHNVKALFEEIAATSDRLKSVIRPDGRVSIIQRRLSVLNSEILNAATEAVNLLTK